MSGLTPELIGLRHIGINYRDVKIQNVRRLLHKFIKIALAINAFYRSVLSKTFGGLFKYLAKYDRIIEAHLRVINTKLSVGIKRFNHRTFIISGMQLMRHMIDEM